MWSCINIDVYQYSTRVSLGCHPNVHLFGSMIIHCKLPRGAKIWGAVFPARCAKDQILWDIILNRLWHSREEEPRYLVRTLISNLRVGANWRSVIPGLARAFVYHDKGLNVSKAVLDAASVTVTEAFHMCPNLDLLIQALREGGLDELHQRCTLKAGKTCSLSASSEQQEMLWRFASQNCNTVMASNSECHWAYWSLLLTQPQDTIVRLQLQCPNAFWSILNLLIYNVVAARSIYSLRSLLVGWVSCTSKRDCCFCRCTFEANAREDLWGYPRCTSATERRLYCWIQIWWDQMPNSPPSWSFSKVVLAQLWVHSWRHLALLFDTCCLQKEDSALHTTQQYIS